LIRGNFFACIEDEKEVGIKGKAFLFGALVVILLAACSTPKPSEDPEPDINVTLQAEEENAYFTVKVQRVGEATPRGAWFIEGEIYLKVMTNVEGPINVVGSGLGTGEADTSGGGATNVSKWKTEYAAQGFFDKKKCEITLKIDETTQYMQTDLTSSSVSVTEIDDYTITLPNVKFTIDGPYIETEILEHPVTWTNTFLLIPNEEVNSTDCLFEMN
jgi:hypothetical protein